MDDVLFCETRHHEEDVIAQVTAKMPSDEDMYGMAELYKNFADVTRIRILSALAIRSLCVCDLVDVLQMSQTAISHQLRILKQAKLVSYVKKGKNVEYSLSDDHVRALFKQAYEHIKE